MHTSFLIRLTGPLFALALVSATFANDGDTLASRYAPYFSIGAAVSTGKGNFDSLSLYPHALLSEFSSLTAENAMKPVELQPKPGVFAWANADAIANYAKENNKKLRGHTLVWHNQSPDWMTAPELSGTARKAKARENMKAHISAVVQRYQSVISVWDVVNEAVCDNWDQGDSIYREKSPWYQAYGDETYIRDAFIFAREANPDALLVYNDYSLCDSEKRERVIKMIRDLDLIKHGLGAVGIQAHWHIGWPSTTEIERTITVFSDLGLDVQITELDIDCYGGSPSSKPKPYKTFEKELTSRYKAIFTCLKNNADKVSSVTFWGVADDHTWLDHFYGNTWHQDKIRKNYPFLFDGRHHKKAAYDAVMDVSQ